MSKYPIVSFFATSPDEDNFPITDYATTPDGSADPTFLPETWAALKSKGGVPMGLPADLKNLPSHMMVRVPSVKQIDSWLAAYSLLGTPNQPIPMLHIQLIGHSGIRGQLALGGAWPVTTPSWKPPFYWFDSNPNALNMLARGGEIAEVMLVGCYVADRDSNITALNGHTLLFALAELWRCRASGAITQVDSTQFDEEGWYVGAPGAGPIAFQWTATATTFSGAANARWSPVLAPNDLKLPAEIASSQGSITDVSLISKFCRYFNATVPREQRPRAALPDVVMTFRYGSRSVPAYLVCNAMFLFVGEGDARVCYANFTRTHSDDVAEVVTRLVPSLLTGESRDARATS